MEERAKSLIQGYEFYDTEGPIECKAYQKIWLMHLLLEIVPRYELPSKHVSHRHLLAPANEVVGR